MDLCFIDCKWRNDSEVITVLRQTHFKRNTPSFPSVSFKVFKFSDIFSFLLIFKVFSMCFIKSKVDIFHILFWTVLVKLKGWTVFHSDFGRHLFPIWKSMLKASFGVLSAIETSCQRMSRCLIFLHNTRWLTDPTPVLGLSSGWDPVSNGSYDFFLWLLKSATNKSTCGRSVDFCVSH